MANTGDDENDVDGKYEQEMDDLVTKVQSGLKIASEFDLPADSGARVLKIAAQLVISSQKREQLCEELAGSSSALHDLVMKASDPGEKVCDVEAAKIFLRTIAMQREIRKRKPEYLFDVTRTSFLTDYVTTVSGLLSGYKRGNNGYKRLLIGAKGVGKSELLKLLELVTVEVFGSERIVCCYVEYGRDLSDDKYPDPFSIIIEQLRRSVQIDETVANNVLGAPSTLPLADLLKQHNKIAILLLDECESLYMRSSNGKHIISSLFAIGGDTSGTLHCIMSGSHAKLQRLCYAKLSLNEASEFPNYTMHFNLNHSKFRKTTIAPFATEQQFRQLCEQVGVRKCVLTDDETFCDLFLTTGGLPRYVLDKAKATEFTAVLISQLNNELARKVLYAVLQALEFRPGEVRAPFNRVLPVRLTDAQIWNEVLTYDDALTDLCNSGVMNYDHDQSLISFAHPGVYDEVLRRVSADYHKETLVMKNPSDDHKMGEQVTAKYFAEHCLHEVTFHFGFKFTSTEYSETSDIRISRGWQNIFVYESFRKTEACGFLDSAHWYSTFIAIAVHFTLYKSTLSRNKTKNYLN